MRTLVVSKNLSDPVTSQMRSLLQRSVDPQGPATISFDNFERTLLPSVRLAVVVVPTDIANAMEVLRRVRQGVQGHVMALGPADDSRLILRALQSGADYFLDQAALESEFEACLARLKIKQQSLVRKGRLLAVLSASGGTGASTLAANVAAVLASEEKKCALIDLKPGRNDLAALLDLKPHFTIADLCQNAERLDRSMFEKMLVRHASGVHLLGSPQVYGDIRKLTAAGVGQGLQMSRLFFPFVVVDLEDCFHEEQVVALRRAADVLLVTRLDFTSLRNARRILEQLNDLDIPPKTVRIVVGRSGQPNELPVDEAAEALGKSLEHFIPDDSKTVNGVNNAGLLVVERAPSSKVAQAMSQVAQAALQRRRSESDATAPASGS